MKRLNNLVTELVSAPNVGKEVRSEHAFSLSNDGWVYCSCTADCTVGMEPVLSIDGVEIAARPQYRGASEAMLRLSAGPHHLIVDNGAGSDITGICVRSIPELAYCKHQYDPHVPEYGPYDWGFISEHVLPHVNTIVGGLSHESALHWWKARAGKWLVETSLVGMNDASVTAAEVFNAWSASPGLTHPLSDGILVDEFFSGCKPQYKAWTDAVSRIAADERFQGKQLYPYLGSHYPDMDDFKRHRGDGEDSSKRFLDVVMKAGYPIAWERYLQERHAQEIASHHITERLGDTMSHWRGIFPDCARSLLVSFGYMTITESLNIHPNADYKVFMDMQFQYLATHRDFQDLFGILEYTSGYADEETVRWAAQLYRHYGIEGNTSLLSDRLGYAYELKHIRNGDFAYGFEGWHVPVDIEDNVSVRHVEGFGHMEGRWPRTPVGDSVLCMKRRSDRANTVSQKICGLQIGKLYSAKMIAGSFDALARGTSERHELGLVLGIHGAELLPEKSFQSVVANNYSHQHGAFTMENKYWFNYYQVVFRATTSSARLTISDWTTAAGADKPAGPVGEELLCNFVEVQPYFDGRT
jgi:hypothetical protein